MAGDPPHAGDHRVLPSGLLPGRLQPVHVAAPVVLEAQGVLGAEPRVALLERSRIQEEVESLPGGETEGLATAGTALGVLLDVGPVDGFPAALALDPQALGDDPTGLVLAEQPGHGRGQPPLTRVAAFRAATNSPTFPTRAASPARDSTRRTMALPTMAPSA